MPLAIDYKIICIDEAHFRRDADKRRCWGMVGKSSLVHVNGSTQSTNIYGAYTLDGKFHYKFAKKQLAVTTVKFFERLRKIYKKIIFVLDRARWHTAKHVIEYAEKFSGDIQFVFFPKTCPDANPVEECWRQTRNNVTANKAFSSTDRLKQALRKEWNKQKFKHKCINYLLP
jgi:transposase